MPITSNRHPPTKRIAVAELMRETDLTAEAIAVKVGVPYATVCRWNQFHNWRPWFRRTPPAVDPRRWSKPRLAALERVYRQPGVDLGDLAQAVGTDRIRQRAFFRECGFDERVEPPTDEVLAEGSLRAALRTHVARQIAGLSAELSLRYTDTAESARRLRDLATLKGLVVQLEPQGDPRQSEPEDEMSLDERRAAIWNRFIAFARARLGPDAPQEELEDEADTIFAERMAECQPFAAKLARSNSG